MHGQILVFVALMEIFRRLFLARHVHQTAISAKRTGRVSVMRAYAIPVMYFGICRRRPTHLQIPCDTAHDVWCNDPSDVLTKRNCDQVCLGMSDYMSYCIKKTEDVGY